MPRAHLHLYRKIVDLKTWAYSKNMRGGGEMEYRGKDYTIIISSRFIVAIGSLLATIQFILEK